MGSSNFFSKIASVDPLAQALDLPGAHKYAQAQAQNMQSNAGPYAGTTPTLADANAGYAPGTKDAAQGWTPNQGLQGGGLFGLLQKNANLVGNSMPYRSGSGAVPTGPGSVSTSNPYVQAAGNWGGG
jgi:hypothetical protein